MTDCDLFDMYDDIQFSGVPTIPKDLSCTVSWPNPMVSKATLKSYAIMATDSPRLLAAIQSACEQASAEATDRFDLNPD